MVKMSEKIPTLFLAEHSGTLGMCMAVVRICQQNDAVLVCDARMAVLKELFGIRTLELDWPEKRFTMVGVERVKEELMYPILKTLGIYRKALAKAAIISEMLRTLKESNNMWLFPTGVNNPNAVWAPGSIGLIRKLSSDNSDINLSFVRTGNFDYEEIPGGKISDFKGKPKEVAAAVEKKYFEMLGKKRSFVPVPMTK